MATPDLLGSQGTFTLFTTRPSGGTFKEGGRRVRLEREPRHPDSGSLRHFLAELEGPPNDLLQDSPCLRVPVSLTELDERHARVRVGTEERVLAVGQTSDWIPLRFPALPGIAIRAICRMVLTELGEEVSLYVTPLHLDPEHPAMPISHPPYYAPYLARKVGPFATAGLAEDTWAMNEGVIDGQAFLDQTYAIDGEREAMLSASLETVRQGAVVCVFDATDRIQHMFWRAMEQGHPAEHADAIERLYEHNDALLGRIRSRLAPADALIVLSDHGFASFRRGMNLNAWLLAQGYLVLQPDRNGTAEWLRDVDWARTRAYALGLTGIFLNLRGREGAGIVAPADAEALRREIRDRLEGLVDADTGEIAVREAFDPAALATGPYLERAPDLIVGYNRGYRASWDGATGVVAGPVFSDNTRPWSGDHCIDPRLVPGVIFSDRPIRTPDPSLVDLAPSALWLFGLETPGYMDGKVLFDPLDFQEAP
jgi:hypothetical protein